MTLFTRLVDIYRGEKIRHPKLRAVTLAQWMLESARGTSGLATLHNNFGGLKWRPEMAPYATKVSYTAHDGVDDYCKFSTIESFINGYYAFLNRATYTGWVEHADDPEDFIRFIGPIYTPRPGYPDDVLRLVPEADALLAATPGPSDTGLAAQKLGTIVIDPGHGGTQNLPGSSWNNAISAKGTLEKKLTLDFALRLRDLILEQCKENGQQLSVVLTRTTDENVSGKNRAGEAFNNKARAFLSIHFNGNTKGSVRGTETYYRAAENGNLNLADDMAFAQVIQDGAMAGMRKFDSGAKDRKIKPDTETNLKKIAVLSDTNLGNNQIPTKAKMCKAALVEFEFITNPTVETNLVSGPNSIANRETLLAEVARAIREYLA